ncbi:hypothetical protein GCM10010269_33540 [Streptomyces humidus]|uniref:Uncharacterized protein n=1 Tax=Streptomyces humidus TaxID=52259 RepID=A0A918FW91_9ACTN|nr:hypothetical protein GCM10010269_33540 [Streptomyces humidus]
MAVGLVPPPPRAPPGAFPRALPADLVDLHDLHELVERRAGEGVEAQDAGVIDQASPLVRPYFVAVERERAGQSPQRIVLALATDFGSGLDRLGRNAVRAERVVAW